MIIQYYGTTSIKAQFGDTTLAFNPISKDSQHKSVSFGADIVLVSLHHPDLDGVEEASRGDKEPFIIDYPGEYEVEGVRVKGLPSTSTYTGKETVHTVFVAELEDMTLCHLGVLSNPDLPSETLEELDDIDVLFAPIGGGAVLSAKEAHKLGVQLEAKLIVPTLYDDKTLKTFLKEEGESNGEPQEKLTIKKKDLLGKEGDIVVLSAA